MHADLLSQETNHFGRVRPVGRTQTAVLCFRAAIQVAFAKNVGYAGWASELRPSLQQFGASNALHAVTVARMAAAAAAHANAVEGVAPAQLELERGYSFKSVSNDGDCLLARLFSSGKSDPVFPRQERLERRRLPSRATVFLRQE